MDHYISNHQITGMSKQTMGMRKSKRYLCNMVKKKRQYELAADSHTGRYKASDGF